jgi:hypothetical protein
VGRNTCSSSDAEGCTRTKPRARNAATKPTMLTWCAFDQNSGEEDEEEEEYADRAREDGDCSVTSSSAFMASRA